MDKRFIGSALAFCAFLGTVSPAHAQLNLPEQLQRQTETLLRPLTGLNLDQAARQFLTSAHQANLSAIRFSQLALDRSTNPQIRQLAQQVIQRSTQADNAINTLSRGFNLALPASLDTTQQTTLNQLSSLSGQPFDQAFLASQLMNNSTEQALYQQVVSRTNNPNVRSFAQGALPTIQSNDQLLQQLCALRTSQK